jgi:LPXTG-site transpeptidase (sortase) family protein
VGHLQGTAWVSDRGNIGLAGHVELSDGRPGVFAHLQNLTTGNEVFLTLPDDTQRIYAVQTVRTVAPDDLSVLYPSSEDRLTLITCDNFDYLSFTYLERIVAVAERVQ